MEVSLKRSAVVSRGVVAVVALVCVTAQPALAHSELEASDPAADTQVGDVPTEVSLTFTETPSPDANVVIRDGCNDDVAGDSRVEGKSLITAVQGGEPGGWSVSYTVISAEDGHESKGDYVFLVQGKQDCSNNDGGNGNNTPGGNGDDIGSGAPPIENDDGSGSSAPVGLIIAGAVALIVIAFLVRRATAPRE
jgi:methionine-rich copper-binding protein CopC